MPTAYDSVVGLCIGGVSVSHWSGYHWERFAIRCEVLGWVFELVGVCNAVRFPGRISLRCPDTSR